MIEIIDYFNNASNIADKSISTIVLFILLYLFYKLVEEKIIKKE